MLREALKTNENLKFFCAPWSPPGRMKTGGSMCGGFMREGFLEEYAAYYCDFLAAYRREGIDIFALTAQNEPETDQIGKMPACLFSPELEAKFIFLLRKNLRERGLNPEIWLCDHNFIYVKRVLWQLKEYPELLSAVNGAAFHYYAGGAEQTEAIRADYPQLGLHFTEGGPGLHNNYAADYCKWGATVCRALNHGFRSFTGWNLLLDESGAPEHRSVFLRRLNHRRFGYGRTFLQRTISRFFAFRTGCYSRSKRLSVQSIRFRGNRNGFLSGCADCVRRNGCKR